MFKVCMCCAVILSSTLVGNWFSARLLSRRKSLLMIIEALTRMKNHFSFSCYEVFRVVSESFSGLEYFNHFCVDTGDECDFALWWHESVRKISADSGLNQEDKKHLIRFSEVLGSTDTEGQISNCELYINVFTERLRIAREAEEKNSRLYRILGFSLGCIVILVVL